MELRVLTSNDENNVFQSFCQNTLRSDEVSIRLVAESESLKAKISSMNGAGDKHKVVKLQPKDGPLLERIDTAKKFNDKGYAVYYLPTYFVDGYDEGYGAALLFRAFVVDLDESDYKPCIESSCPPTAVIETSEGKFQCVWALDKPLKVTQRRNQGLSFVGDMDCDEYNEIASRLALLFDGDQNVCKATQPFRAPGFKHWKESSGSEGFTSRTVFQNVAVSIDAIKSLFKSRGVGTALLGRATRETTRVHLDAVESGDVTIDKGERHDTILRLATKLFHEGLSESDVRSRVEAVIRRQFASPEDFITGSRSGEITKSITDARSYCEKNRNRERQEIAAQLKSVVDAAEELKSEDEEEFQYDFTYGSLRINRYTETAIVERCFQRFGGDLARIDDRIYCFHRGQRLWKLQRSDSFPEVKARVHRVIQDAVLEPEFLTTVCVTGSGKPSASAKRVAEGAYLKAGAVSAMCRGMMNNIAVPGYEYKDFDADLQSVYCCNGVIRMTDKVLTLRAATAGDRLMRQTSCCWEGEGATCPGWMQFLSEIFSENDDPGAMISFIQELFGYSLSGEIGEEKIFCHWGDGCNGKSKLLSALRRICGDYATVIEPDEIVQKKNGFSKSFERTGAKVEGHRVAIIDDLDVATVWNEGFVKTLTAKNFRARAEYERSREVPNRCKFHIGLNVAPEPEAENLGILRRLCIIPYKRTFEPRGDTERALCQMLEDEAGGILAWAIRGYARYAARGCLEYPEETVVASRDYRKKHFHLESAIEECFEVPVGVTGESIAEELTLAQMCEVVNDYYDSQGHEGARVSPESLGRALKKGMHLESKKVWNKETENMHRVLSVVVKFKPKSKALGVL